MDGRWISVLVSPKDGNLVQARIVNNTFLCYDNVTIEQHHQHLAREAISAGFYHSPGWNKDYPRIQLLTIAELLKGVSVDMPPQHGTFKQAQKVKPEALGEQLDMPFE